MKRVLTVVGVAVLAAVASMVVSAPPAHAAVGLHVSGTNVVEANGQVYVMRGVNHPHVWFTNQASSFANIKALGANTVRVVLGSGHRGWGTSTPSDVANVISLCKQHRLICVLELHDTTGFGEQSGAASLDQAVSFWTGLKDVLVGQENYVVINIGNEPIGNNNAAQWTQATAREATVYSGTTTSPPAGGSCTAAYAILGQWPGGFQAEVRVTAGGSAITGWTVTHPWNATVTSNGPSVTAHNMDYNGNLNAGGSATFGFLGSWNGTNNAPAITCTAN